MTDRRLRRTIAALSTAGMAIAGYLTYVHYAGLDPACAGGGCERVQSSDYSELAGVPVALVGLVGYALIFASLLLRGDVGRFVTASLCLVGFGFSAWLTYLELVEIEAICQWCVASAVVMTGLAVVAALRLLAPT